MLVCWYGDYKIQNCKSQKKSQKIKSKNIPLPFTGEYLLGYRLKVFGF
jgi:hypothetical protein